MPKVKLGYLKNNLYIDKEIMPELICMNENGFKTCDSCAGHLYNNSINIDFLSYIAFIPTKSQVILVKDLIKKENFIKKYEIGNGLGFIYIKEADLVDLQIEFKHYIYNYTDTISVGLEANEKMLEVDWNNTLHKYYAWFFKKLRINNA